MAGRQGRWAGSVARSVSIVGVGGREAGCIAVEELGSVGLELGSVGVVPGTVGVVPGRLGRVGMEGSCLKPGNFGRPSFEERRKFFLQKVAQSLCNELERLTG